MQDRSRTRFPMQTVFRATTVGQRFNSNSRLGVRKNQKIKPELSSQFTRQTLRRPPEYREHNMNIVRSKASPQRPIRLHWQVMASQLLSPRRTPSVPPEIESAEHLERDAPYRRNVLADQQRPERHHPKAKHRQKTENTADDERKAERPSYPPRLRPDQPCVEL